MPRKTASQKSLFAALLVGGLLAWGPAAQGQPGIFGIPANSGDVNNVFPLAPRELRQRLSRAQAAVDEERYSDAVAEIGEVLNSAGSDDFFLGIPGGADAQVSLKTEAMALLGAMPAKGRKLYDVQYGADAKAGLEAALAAGDLAQLTEVSRRYFQTKAGYEATLLLGRYQLDQGRPLAAALTLKRVADVPTAQAQYDPELSVLLATCWLHANQPQQAQETLLALKKRLPRAKIKLVDREAKLFDRDTAALEWLQDIVGGSRTAFSSAATQWVMYRGDEKRNAQSNGGMPLLNFNWKLPTINDPTDEQRVAKQYRNFRDRDDPLVCSLQPLVVQDYVIVRQPESNKLIGINLNKSGKREWVYPPFDESAPAQVARQALQSSRNPATNSREEELTQRIWQDNIFGQVSSDGRQVYVLDDLAPVVMQPQVIIGRGGRGIPNPNINKANNLLVALDLARQGYQLWAVGGTTGDNPALAGAFFLGPPLPVGDQLYALAEFTGEIRLVCLDARTGGLEWKQPLANMEADSITTNMTRRMAGASPSLADGILVCPTSAGAVVAVDLATRTLRWGYQYARHDIVNMMQRGGGFRGPMMQMPNPTPGGNWLDATVTIADGCVILTPPESKQLHCLDLLTGKAKWSPISRDNMLLVACVHQGKIILIGKNSLRAINLADGKPAQDWASGGELKLDGEVAVGRGYYSDSFYYLPVSGQQICKIDLNGGSIAGRTQTEVELGNLVCYKDQLISVSPQSVASFVLLSDHLQKQLQERLAANPQDIDALALKAQILFQEGSATESLTLLRRAAEQAPERPMIRTLLVKVMLALVRQDFATHAALTDELEKLVADPAQRREVLRYRVQGLAQTDRVWDAFSSLLELADQELLSATSGAAPAALVAIDRQRNVRIDRWLQRQLQTLLDRADSSTRERIESELKQRLDKAIAIGGVHPLRMYLNLFGFHELSDAARVALIDRLISADALVEAEVLAGDLVSRRDAAKRGAAWISLATIYEKAKRPELAARVFQQLSEEFAGVVLRGGQTGRDFAQQARQNPALKAYFEDWPRGAVEVKESDASGMMQRMPFPLPVSHYFGVAPRGMKVSYDPQNMTVIVRSDTGQVTTTAAIRSNNTNGRGTMFTGSNSLTAQANGHLAILHLGADVAAVDGLRSDRSSESLLWRQDTGEDLSGGNNVPAGRRNANPLLGGRTVVYESMRKVNYATGPVTGGGVCFQRGRQLVCVDPLTGTSLWERSSSNEAEIPQQAEIFGDEEVLLVADARPDSKADEALLLSAIDGSLIGKRKIDPADRRWATHGRRVLAWEDKNSVVTVRLYDAAADKNAVAEKRELWSRQVASGSRGCLIDGEELAILEPAGQLTVVSLESGKVRFSVPLESESKLAWIQVIRSENQYLLLASQEISPAGISGLAALQIYGGAQQKGMHGRVYAFSRETGKLQWQTPAFVSHHWLPPDQPTESPLLLFVASRNANNKLTTAVLALDRRSGRNVYQKEFDGMASNCDIMADPVKHSASLLLGQTGRAVTFQFTDRPLAPEPPANTGETASAGGSRPAGAADRSLGPSIDLLRRAQGNSPAPGR
jgi:outer membrane protein assembly factor BamB